MEPREGTADRLEKGTFEYPRSLPVTINWDRLDSRWIETLLKGAGEEGAEAVPEAHMFASFVAVQINTF